MVSEIDSTQPPSKVFRSLMERGRRCRDFIYDGQFYPNFATCKINIYLLWARKRPDGMAG
ncbi:hypothetical protein C2U69_27560 [Cupriavidus pinatubonensis]|nr:hypothetical protein C2U69_27560 [Cupriavidus pinatubonensis]